MKKLLSSLLVLGLLAGCAGGKNTDDKTITVGASTAPHAEILNALKEDVAAEGYELVVKEFDDYVVPNTALDEGSLDANYFQHLPYLEGFNKDNNTKISSVLKVHFEPLGIYAGKQAINNALTVDDIPEGAKIGVPNDGTNEARALQLLSSIGVITLKDGVGLEATKQDIVSNPKNVEIVELEAKTIPSTLTTDLDYGVINGNYALSGNVTDRLCVAEAKDSEGALTFANILAVKTGEEETEKTKVLEKVLTSDKCRQFIEDTYDGLVVPVF